MTKTSFGVFAAVLLALPLVGIACSGGGGKKANPPPCPSVAAPAAPILPPVWGQITSFTYSNGPVTLTREGMSAVYDAANDRQINFGGTTLGLFSPATNDVVVISNPAGISGPPDVVLLAPTGTPPAARTGQATAYDAATNTLIVFGGSPSSGPRDDTWILSNANGLGGTPAWTLLTPAATPGVRSDASAVYDPSSNELIIYGGTHAGTLNYNETWILTNANGTGGAPVWTMVTPAGGLPPGLTGHIAAYDANTNRMIIHGGNSLNPNQPSPAGYIGDSDTWVLSNANGLGGGAIAWGRLTPATTPPGRIQGSGFFDAPNNRLVVFGGGRGSLVRNDVWVLSNANGSATGNWTEYLTAPGAPPAGRLAHAGIYSAATNRMVVFGGDNGSYLAYGDLWVLRNGNGTFSAPASIEVLHDATSVCIGSTLGLTAVAKDGLGNPIEIRTLLWSSSIPGTATVGTAGLVTGIAIGSSDVTACDGLVCSVPLAVNITTN